MSQNVTFPIVFKTSEDVNKHIKKDETKESLYLEFKKELPIRQAKKNLAMELAADICQFSNTYGGTIIIGIEESTGPNNNFKTAQNYFNVSNIDDIRRYLNDVVAKIIYPTTVKFFECHTIQLQTGETLLAINIKPIEYGVASINSESNPEIIKYPYRTDYGKNYLNPNQVLERIMNNNRSTVIKLNRLKNTCITDPCGAIIDLLSPIYNTGDGQKTLTKDYDVYLVELSESEFKIKLTHKNSGLVNGITLVVPYSLIEHLWQTDQNKVGMIFTGEHFDSTKWP